MGPSRRGSLINTLRETRTSGFDQVVCVYMYVQLSLVSSNPDSYTGTG